MNGRGSAMARDQAVELVPFFSISQGYTKWFSIANQLVHHKFISSDGWINQWKKRHDLNYTKLYGKNSEADEEAAATWTSENLREVLKRYEPTDIYNADEIAFYFQALPDSTCVKKSSRKMACGSKVSEDRLTVLVCCSLSSDKYGLLVIGTSKKKQDASRIFECFW